ncbi:MAG: hypothetical protein NT005_02735, partial [Spirochaetes bacterium]|nr:hypothetical protein [Spirochaetota bacterium]
MYRESNCSWCGTIGFGLRILNLDRFAERYEQNARILAHRYLRRQQERRDLVEEEAWERAL